MRVNNLQPTLSWGEARARQDADPSLEGEMLRAAKRSQEVSTPVGVELIDATGDSPDHRSRGDTGSLIDTYA